MRYVPSSELRDRRDRFQTRLRESGLDGALVLQKADLFYLTGTAQNGVLFVPPEGDPVLAVRRSVTRARAESAWEDVVPLRRYGELPGLLAERGHRSLSRLGVETDVLPAALYFQLGKVFKDARLEDVSWPLRETRMVKSDFEIACIEGAAAQAHAVFAAIPDMIRGGCRREIELAAEIERAFRRNRHQGFVRCRGFGREMYFGAVSAGATASHPTDFDGPDGVEGLYAAIPQSGGEREIRAGEPLFVDLVGGFDGYLADKTRIFAVGGIEDPELVRAHAFALEIQAEVASRLVPGAPSGGIYREVEALVKQSPFADAFMGYGDNRSRFVGHGVGLELDELPVLTPGSDVVLEAGMTVAVEPKFFFGERGGVGIENTWVVTGTGGRNLTQDDDAIVIV